MRSSSATAPSSLRAFHTTAFALVAALLAASVIHAGWKGALAASFGALGTALFLAGTWSVVKLASATATQTKPDPRQVALIVLFLLLKLPLIYLGWVLSQRLGPFGPTWFLLGLGSVYSLVVWRAVLASRD